MTKKLLLGTGGLLLVLNAGIIFCPDTNAKVGVQIFSAICGIIVLFLAGRIPTAAQFVKAPVPPPASPRPETLVSTLAQECALPEDLDENDLYSAMDWLLPRLIKPSLFDEKNLAEIQSPDFPDERLVVCRNPLLARSRTHKREELLAATEADLAKIAAAVHRPKRPLRGEDRIGLKVGRVIDRHKMAKRKARTKMHPRGTARPQLPDFAQRPRHHHPQHHCAQPPGSPRLAAGDRTHAPAGKNPRSFTCPPDE